MAGRVTIESLESYSRLFDLGHSRERLEELAPRVEELLARIDALRQVDVTDTEMAVTYSAGGVMTRNG
jgi:hypothetical protein